MESKRGTGCRIALRLLCIAAITPLWMYWLPWIFLGFGIMFLLPMRPLIVPYIAGWNVSLEEHLAFVLACLCCISLAFLCCILPRPSRPLVGVWLLLCFLGGAGLWRVILPELAVTDIFVEDTVWGASLWTCLYPALMGIGLGILVEHGFESPFHHVK